MKPKKKVTLIKEVFFSGVSIHTRQKRREIKEKERQRTGKEETKKISTEETGGKGEIADNNIGVSREA